MLLRHVRLVPTTDTCTAAIVASRSSGLFGNSSPKPRPRAADPLVGLAPSGARSAMMSIAIFLALAARRWRIARGPPITILGGGHGEKTHRHSHGRRRRPRPQRGDQERDLSRQ